MVSGSEEGNQGKKRCFNLSDSYEEKEGVWQRMAAAAKKRKRGLYSDENEEE